MERENQWVKDTMGHRGGYGMVTRWAHKTSRERVAIKRFLVKRPRNAADAKLASEHSRQCQEEVDRMIRLEHPNIVRAAPISPDLQEALDLEPKMVNDGEEEREVLPTPILCMEFCNGGDLGRILQLPDNLSGLPEDDVRAVLLDLCAGLLYLHDQNIIHRDIKPANVLLHFHNPNQQVTYKLGDLGLSKDVPSISKSFSSRVGTINYMAPELSRSPRTDFKIDYWSLGMTVLETMYGTWHLRRYGWREDEGPPKQHRLSAKFSKIMETWLTSMLEMRRQDRGVMGKNLKKIFFQHHLRHHTVDIPEDPIVAIGPESLKIPENALTWMIKFLRLRPLRLVPNISLLIDKHSFTTPGLLQKQILAPWISSRTDAFVYIGENGLPRLVRPDEAPWHYAETGERLVPLSRSVTEEYKLRIPGRVQDLFHDSLSSFESSEEQRQLWIDVLFYMRNELGIARGGAQALECLERLEFEPNKLRFAVFQNGTFNRASERKRVITKINSDPEVFPEAKEVVEERKRLLLNLASGWNVVRKIYKEWSVQGLDRQRLTLLKGHVALFARDQKKFMDSILTRFRYLTPKKITAEIQCEEKDWETNKFAVPD